MRIVFAGTPDFATPCLQACLNSSHQVVAVYTQPDRPSGRGLSFTQSPVKQLALKAGVPVEQPESLRDLDNQHILQSYAADIIIVVAYGLLFPKEVLSMPTLACVNVHASLLPRWRGAAPIQSAILHGDAQTGISYMIMDEGLDCGEVLEIQRVTIMRDDNGQTLHDRLAELGARHLVRVIDEYAAGKLLPKAQANQGVTYAKKINKGQVQIDWHKSAHEIERMVRAYYPWPIAFTYLDQLLVRVYHCEVIAGASEISPGTILAATSHGLDVMTSQGAIRITECQLPGGKALPFSEIIKSKQELFTPGKVLRAFVSL